MKIMTAINSNIKVIKITTLRKMVPGRQYFAEIHDRRGVFYPVKSVYFNNDLPMKVWDGGHYVDVELGGRGKVRFTSHLASGPIYPVTQIMGCRGKPKNIRVTFYVETGTVNDSTIIDAEFSEITENLVETKPVLQIAAPALMLTHTPEITNDNVEPENTKPVREDGESFGKYMARLNRWKKEQIAA